MSAQVTINSLPAAGPITGTEAVPIVQNGVTVQTTTGAISASPSQNQTFLTLNQEATLPNSRYLSTTNGLSLTDGGPQSFYRLGLGGAAGSLQTASNGLVVKDSGNTVVARQIAVSGSGLGVTNADGTSGDPTIQLTGIAAAIASLSGTGMLALTAGGTSVAGRNLLGTANQIDVVNGNGALGNPTVSIADDAVFPGTGAITVPIGTAAQQPLGSDGKIRYNSDLSLFEGYANGSWRVFGLSGGVLSFSGGSTGLTPAVATPGIVTLGGILNVANGGTGVTTSTGTGSVVLNNSPTFITPALGTPASGVATNLTGLPLTTGVTGTLPVANGGTGLTSYTANGVVYASGTGTLATGSALTFNGTNLGVGLSVPSARLHSYALDGAYLLAVSGTTKGLRVVTDSTATSIQGVDTSLTGSYQPLVLAGLDLRFQSNGNTERMRLDASGNLGIGTSSPSFPLEVATAAARVRVIPSTNTNSAFFQSTNAGGSGYFGLDSSTGSLGGAQYALNVWHNSAYPILFGTNNAERARIDSTGNLLVGTTTNTNTSRIVSAGTISETVGTTQYLVASQYDIGTAPNQIPLNQYLGGLAYEDAANIAGQVGVIAGTAALPSLVSATDTDTGVWFPAANTLAMSTGGAERVRVDSSGNLGLGVVPSAWASTFKAGQINLAALAYDTANGVLELSNNSFASSAATRNYIISSGAARYQQSLSGVHAWFTAPSGTAGNAISFTQAMTLDASGNLGVGTSSPLTRLNVVDSSTNTFAGAFRGSGGTNIVALGTTSGGASIAGYTASFAATADLIVNPSGGNLGLGVTPSAWNISGNFELRNTTAIAFAGQLGTIATNAYYNSQWFYKTNNFAAIYEQNAGAHRWYNAPSGTAGNAITFTQAMTLDASGNLGVGTTSPGAKIHAVAGNIRITSTSDNNNGILQIQDTAISTTLAAYSNSSGSFIGVNQAKPLAFFTNNTERMRLDASGNLLVGTTAAGTTAANVIGMGNATAPTTSPANMGQLYVEAGALKYRGSSGTVTTIAVA